MQSYIIFVAIILILFRTVRAKDFPMEELETFPVTHDVENSLCSCKDELLCVPLIEAMNRNSTAPHVLNYIKKSKKTEV